MSDPATAARLLDVLDQLATLLTSHAEPRWGAFVARSADLIRAGDAEGVARLLEGFGGMGSLADLVFDPANGNARSTAEANDLNQQLTTLRSEAWRLATDLRRETTRS